MKRMVFAAATACALLTSSTCIASDGLWDAFWSDKARAPASAPVPAPRPGGRILQAPDGIHALVTRVAREVRVDVPTAHAVVRLESGYRPAVRGAAGEYGLTQIKCQTARGLGFAGPCSALLDPAINLRWGLTHLRVASNGSTACAYVARHNLGMYARPRCTAYGQRVVSLARRLAGAS